MRQCHARNDRFRFREVLQRLFPDSIPATVMVAHIEKKQKGKRLAVQLFQGNSIALYAHISQKRGQGTELHIGQRETSRQKTGKDISGRHRTDAVLQAGNVAKTPAAGQHVSFHQRTHTGRHGGERPPHPHLSQPREKPHQNHISEPCHTRRKETKETTLRQYHTQVNISTPGLKFRLQG